MIIKHTYPHGLRLCLAVVLIKQNWKMTLLMALFGAVVFFRDTCQMSKLWQEYSTEKVPSVCSI